MKRYLVALIFLAAPVWADTESQSSGTESGTNWSTLSNVRTSDNNRAVYTNTAQDWADLTNFGFSSVTGTIDSIRVNIEGHGVDFSATNRELDVQLIKGGTGTGDIVTVTLPISLSEDADIQEANGSTNALWNVTWAASDITASNFGCRIRDQDATADALKIDHVVIYVHYTPSAGGASQTIHVVVGQ